MSQPNGFVLIASFIVIFVIVFGVQNFLIEDAVLIRSTGIAAIGSLAIEYFSRAFSKK